MHTLVHPQWNRNDAERAASLGGLYPLRDQCTRCGTGHLSMPGGFGRCRRCDALMGAHEPDYLTAHSLPISTPGSKTGPALKSKALRGDRSRAHTAVA